MALLHMLATIGTVAAAFASQAWVVNRAEVIVRTEPSANAAEAAKLPLGARVVVSERKRGWVKVGLPDGKVGWLLRRALARKMPSVQSLCSRGRSRLARSSFQSAIVYLQAALDRGMRDRACLDALERAYALTDQRDKVQGVRERIRRLEHWAVGTWCNVTQKIVLTMGEDGRYELKSDGKTVSAGRFDVKEDELLLHAEGGAAEDVSLSVRKRGVGYVLVARSADELQPDFCADK